MMPGSKGLSPHELAHRWVKDLRTRPDMSIKVGCWGFCPRHHIIIDWFSTACIYLSTSILLLLYTIFDPSVVFFYEKAQIIHKIHRVIHIYTRVICGYVDCHVVYQLCYHIECHRCCHNQASQNRSTFLATVSTVTGTTCSHSLGNILR